MQRESHWNARANCLYYVCFYVVNALTSFGQHLNVRKRPCFLLLDVLFQHAMKKLDYG